MRISLIMFGYVNGERWYRSEVLIIKIYVIISYRSSKKTNFKKSSWKTLLYFINNIIMKYFYFQYPINLKYKLSLIIHKVIHYKAYIRLHRLSNQAFFYKSIYH